jgi:hypothetical protein
MPFTKVYQEKWNDTLSHLFDKKSSTQRTVKII